MMGTSGEYPVERGGPVGTAEVGNVGILTLEVRICSSCPS